MDALPHLVGDMLTKTVQSRYGMAVLVLTLFIFFSVTFLCLDWLRRKLKPPAAKTPWQSKPQEVSVEAVMKKLDPAFQQARQKWWHLRPLRRMWWKFRYHLDFNERLGLLTVIAVLALLAIAGR